MPRRRFFWRGALHHPAVLVEPLAGNPNAPGHGPSVRLLAVRRRQRDAQSRCQPCGPRWPWTAQL